METSLNRRAKLELFEQIRREYEHGVGTIKGVARKLGVHRRLVREALTDAVPKERKKPERERPKLLEAIPSVSVAESTVREYVRKKKATLGLMQGETFIPQSYNWGSEGQVDWYEA